MKVQNAVLIPETLSPVGEGVSGAQRALVRLSGTTSRCIVKWLNHRSIAVECFCSVLGDVLSLPSVPPVVVVDPRDKSLLFGSLEIAYPSLSTRLRWVNEPSRAHLDALAEILTQWAQLGHVICFDELVCNPDRNIGNVLWNGVDFFVIDHERALTSTNKVANKLALIVKSLLTPAQLDSIVQTGTTAALTFGSLLLPASPRWADIRGTFSNLSSEISDHYDALVQIVTTVVPLLLPRVVDTIPPPLFELGAQ